MATGRPGCGGGVPRPVHRSRLPGPHPRHLDAAARRRRRGHASTCTGTSTARCRTLVTAAAAERAARRAGRHARTGSASGCSTSTAGVLDAALVGRAVDAPGLRDAALRDRISRLHAALRSRRARRCRPSPGWRWSPTGSASTSPTVRRRRPKCGTRPGGRLRELLDESVPEWTLAGGRGGAARPLAGVPGPRVHPASTACRRTATSPAAGSTWPAGCCSTAIPRRPWPRRRASTTSPT